MGELRALWSGHGRNGNVTALGWTTFRLLVRSRIFAKGNIVRLLMKAARCGIAAAPFDGLQVLETQQENNRAARALRVANLPPNQL
jgi:hypothetical protein